MTQKPTKRKGFPGGHLGTWALVAWLLKDEIRKPKIPIPKSGESQEVIE